MTCFGGGLSAHGRPHWGKYVDVSFTHQCYPLSRLKFHKNLTYEGKVSKKLAQVCKQFVFDWIYRKYSQFATCRTDLHFLARSAIAQVKL